MESVHFVPDQCANFASHFSSVKIFQKDFSTLPPILSVSQIYFSDIFLSQKWKNPISNFPLQLPHSALISIVNIRMRMMRMRMQKVNWISWWSIHWLLPTWPILNHQPAFSSELLVDKHLNLVILMRMKSSSKAQGSLIPHICHRHHRRCLCK